jgi:hypothetical protein
MKFKLILPIVLLWLPLSAQEAQPTPEPRSYTFNAYIWAQSSVSMEGSGFPEVYYFDGEQERRFEVRRGAVSRRYRAKGDGNLQFYRKQVQEDPDTGEEVVERVPFVSASIPEGWSHALLLFFPAAGEGYSIVPVAKGPERIPEGSVGVYNTSENPLAILRDGEAPLVVPPNGMQVFEPEIEGTRAAHGFRLNVAIRRDGEWESAYSRSHRLLPGKNPLISAP